MTQVVIPITVNPTTVTIISTVASTIYSSILPSFTPVITQEPQFILDPNVQELLGIIVTIITIVAITSVIVIKRNKDYKRKLLEHDIAKREHDIATHVQEIVST